MNAHTIPAPSPSIADRSFAPLTNVVLMVGIVQRMQDRGQARSGFGAFYGWSGYGKTEATIYAKNRVAAPCVEIGESWTKKDLFTKILIELGVTKPKGTLSVMTEQAIEIMSAPGHPPLLIDEADKLVDKSMIENIRELQKASRTSIILIGEELLPAKLERIERVHERVVDWVPAQPATLEDTRKLAALVLPKVRFDDAVLEQIRTASAGKARLITWNLDKCWEFTRTRGLEALVGDGPLPEWTNGRAPVRPGRTAARKPGAR